MEEWLQSPFVNDVIYFGRSEQGLEIGNQIYAAGKKPVLELSGNDIMVVWKDADLEGAVGALMDAFLGSMQICMVPKAALIHHEVFERFKELFISRIGSMKVGLPSDPETCLTPVMRIKEYYDFSCKVLTMGIPNIIDSVLIGDFDENYEFINPKDVKSIIPKSDSFSSSINPENNGNNFIMGKIYISGDTLQNGEVLSRGFIFYKDFYVYKD